MLINEVAKLTGMSKRTLHYYHQRSLVVPERSNESGYRHYTNEHLKQLEHIQFFKELGFSLKDIKKMMQNKQFSSLEAFELQYRSLVAKQEHLQKQITRIKQLKQLITDELKGDYDMSNDQLNFNLSEYEQEAREKWGNDAVDESIFKLKHLSEEQQTALQQKWDNIYYALAKQMPHAIDSEKTELLVKEYYTLLNTYFGTYDYNAFIGLGQLYIYDERFTTNINKYAAGLAQYMCEAMVSWGSKQLQK